MEEVCDSEEWMQLKLMEKKITDAMVARVGMIRDQEDVLTLESLRRVLEKDLGLKTNALDVHKRFIKHCLWKCCYKAANVEIVWKSSTAKEIIDIQDDEISGSLESHRAEKDVREHFRSSKPSENKDVVEIEEGEVRPEKRTLSKANTQNGGWIKNRKRYKEEMSPSTYKRKKSVGYSTLRNI